MEKLHYTPSVAAGKREISLEDILLEGVTAQSGAGAGVGFAERLRELRQRLGGLGRNAFARRSSMDPAIFLTVALSIGAAAVMGALYTPSYTVKVDGVSVGVVADRADVARAVDRVEARAGSILGRSYTLDVPIEYAFGLTARDGLTPVSTVESYLLDQVDAVVKTSVLTVGGQLVGASNNAATLQGLLDAVKAPYVNENTIAADFVQPVNISREYTAASVEQDLTAMNAILTANSSEQAVYTAQGGDTFSGIANGHDMTMAQLTALNPGVDPDKIMVGQQFTIQQAVPFLTVRTVDAVTYQEAIPYETQQVEDASMYDDETKVLTPGANGAAQVSANVTLLNGLEQSRAVTSTVTVAQPVTQVVAVGTMERPRTMATGHLNWPVSGRVTSGFGYRSIFGSYSYHAGIDISVPYGTSVAASDGGTVTFAGRATGSMWSYGNLVIIDHGNGIQTYYGHNSSVTVSVGDKVYQGQTIAKAGSTGRSTGNHCHFQVKVNGQDVSPYTYLP